ncbi:aminopeptidase [Desulfosarcina ovata subsp. sediminis]|uniref:Aminopeptidase n=1 Tax=Desulfosarcina ovata subsp. sediminis TaxID=885957 RepID=A0A5K7ZH24_9BACT|nr:aminopeptidase [Desulfosarcina ovata]BBO79575.1 aminopeptidase [Desulfosarcina ovata subsp. sediminis]
MLTNVQLERYAEVLLWGLRTARRKPFKRGDVVLVRFNLDAVSLAEVLERRLLEMGMNPVRRLNPTPAMESNFFQLANRRQLVFDPPGESELYQHLNGSIFLHAPASITHLSKIDPKKISRFTLSKKYLRDILEEREQTGDFSWTLCMLPTAELAKHARMEKSDYAKQIIKACFLNRQDPVAQWKSVFKNAAAIKKWLNGMDVTHYHVESENADLVITPGKKRKWIGISGHNIPSFELFISPDWRGTRGVYYADQPSYRSGNLVRQVRLTFKKGVAVDVEAESGSNFVKKQLSMDRGASRIGEFSLTDKRFSKIDRFMANTLFDENYGGRWGNCHVALGSSYADTFDGDIQSLTKEKKNRLGFNDSALHWDLVNTEKKRVTAHLSDGRRTTIYEDGCFAF